jgi:hypothetical protein
VHPWDAHPSFCDCWSNRSWCYVRRNSQRLSRLGKRRYQTGGRVCGSADPGRNSQSVSAIYCVEHSACAGDQFLAGTRNIWWLSFCVDPLPVAGQVVLMRESLARLSGRFLSLYKRPMLCFSTGPSFKITETSMSCVPPHLLQSAKILY